MPAALNNFTAPDAYGKTGELVCGDAVRFNLHVFNQGVYFRIAQKIDGMPANYGQEIYRAPGLYSYDRPDIARIQVRAAIPAASLPAGSAQAQVTIDAWYESELPGGGPDA